MALIPCPACRRHVYASETTCPFCDHELSGLDTTALPRAPAGRMSRAALVVLGMSGAACAYKNQQPDRTSDPSVQSAYGGPPIGFTDVTSTVSTAAGIPFPTTGGNVGTGGAPTGGAGGDTGDTDNGGAAGEANDTSRGGAAGDTNHGGAAGEANGS